MPYVPSSKTPNKDDDRVVMDPAIKELAVKIAEVSKRHGHEAAWAGELNYALTRLLQELPRALVVEGVISGELRYWIQPLMYGVLGDVANEHKLRVNVAYEAHQILKSGDCYDTPYYTKLIEVVDELGTHIGWQHVLVQRSASTVNKDKLDTKIQTKGIANV